MQKSTKASLYIVGLLTSPALTGCGSQTEVDQLPVHALTPAAGKGSNELCSVVKDGQLIQLLCSQKLKPSAELEPHQASLMNV